MSCLSNCETPLRDWRESLIELDRRREFWESTGSGGFVSRRSMCCWNRLPAATSSLQSMRCCSVSSTGTTNGRCGATKVSMIAYFQAGAMARLDRVGQGVRAVGWTAAGVADGQRTGFHIHCAATVLPGSDRYLLDLARDTVEQRTHRILMQPTAEGMPQPQSLDESTRSDGRDRRLQGRPQQSAPTLIAGLPHPGRVRCPMHPHPPTRGLRD